MNKKDKWQIGVSPVWKPEDIFSSKLFLALGKTIETEKDARLRRFI